MATLSLIGSVTAGYKIRAGVVSVLFVVLGKISSKLDQCWEDRTARAAATSPPWQQGHNLQLQGERCPLCH